MHVWRLCRARHAATAFSGDGARIAGGRWNPRGTAVAYCASSLSLAALELFVHVDPMTAPADLVAVEAELPDDRAEVLDVAALPPDWRAVPAPDELKEIGAAWVRSARSLALVVPSAVVPQERNVLVNPAHVHLPVLRTLGATAFTFDPRMWK
jgi:RES domain-containing protein